MRQRRTEAELLEARSLLAVVSITAPYPNPPTTPFVEGTSWSSQIANFTTNDGGLPSQYNVLVDWGDGTSPSPATVTTDVSNSSLYDVAATHTYRNAGTYSVTISIQDSVDDTNAAGTGQIQVMAQTLTPTASQPTVSTTQGASLVNVDVATFTDANPLALPSDFTATIDWGDGQSAGTIVEDSNNVFHVEGSHIYSSPSPPTGFDLQSTIQHTGTSSSLTINNAATVAAASMTVNPATVAISDSSINGSGMAYIPAGTVVGTFTDMGGPHPTSDYTSVNSFVTFPFPGGPSTTPIAISATVPNGSTYTVTTAADTIVSPRLVPGSLGFLLQITNSSNGVVAQGTGVLNVSDAPLAPPVSGQPAIAAQTRGTAFTGVIAGFTDPDTQALPADFTPVINWGDGTAPSTGTVTELTPGTYAITGTHLFTTASPPAGYALSIHVQGLVSSIVLANSVVVHGAPITVVPASFTVSDASINSSGQAIIPAGTAVGTFTDNGGADPAINYVGAGSFASISGSSSPTPILVSPIVPGSATFSIATAAETVISPRLNPGSSIPFTVQITNTDGAMTASANGTYTVTDAPLGLPAAGEPPVPVQTRGGNFSATVAAFTDPNTLAMAGDFTATINWGDGSAPSSGVVLGSAGLFTVQGTHTYSAASPLLGYPISIMIQGQVSTITLANTIQVSGSAITLAPAAVTISAGSVNNLNQPVVPAGTLLGTFTDSGGGDPAANYTGAASYATFPGSAPTPLLVAPISTGSATFSITTAADAVILTGLQPGTASFSLRITNSDGGSTAAGTGPFIVTSTPIAKPSSGEPVIPPQRIGTAFSATVASFTDSNPQLTAADFTATINWGDGSPTTAGLVVGSTNGGFEVVGSHTYNSLPPVGAAFPVTVAISDRSGDTLSISNTAPVVAASIAISGQLNPASDTGYSAFDAVTNNVQPNFFGQTEPNASVELYAQSSGGPALFIGTTVANSAGAWNITSNSLPQGAYTITCTAIDTVSQSRATTQILPNSQQGPLTIVTESPVVSSVAFERASNQIIITYSDSLTGFDAASLVDGGNYRLTRRSLRGEPNLVNQITLVPGSQANTATVVLSLNHGRPLPNGYYYLVINAGGVQDAAGNALSGVYNGTFPTAPQASAGDFVAQFELMPRRTFGPVPLSISAHPSTLRHVPRAVTPAHRIMALPAALEQTRIANQALDPTRIAAIDNAIASLSFRHKSSRNR